MRSKPATAFRAHLEIAIQRLNPDATIYTRVVGKFRNPAGQVVNVPKEGMCDLYVLLRGGRHLEIEIKTAGDVERATQIAWAKECRLNQVPIYLARAQENTAAVFADAAQQCAEWVRSQPR